MSYLLIENVGPITKRIKINLKRFNVFIGPQSSGKSTIAKILSTCSWVEKEAIISLSERVVPNNDFKTMLEDYHRMHQYIHEASSVIVYDSNYIHLEYNKSVFSLKLKDWQSYRRVKSTYVPSDRNVVVMPDIEMRNLEETDFRSFLFDWLFVHKSYDMTNKLDLLDMGVQYYFDENAKINRDKVIHSNGQTYNISLYDASSGLQSLVPMYGLMTYLSRKYFDDYDKFISFEEEAKKRGLIANLVTQILRPNWALSTTMSNRDVMTRVADEEEHGNVAAAEAMHNFIKIFDNLSVPNNIQYIIEEPEQNLFPSTQVQLINSFFALCNQERKHSATITTHSPYILAAINILLFAWKLISIGGDTKFVAKYVPIDSLIKPDEIGVYAIGNGGVRSIIDKETGLIDQNDLDTASEYNAGVFDKLYSLYIKSNKK